MKRKFLILPLWLFALNFFSQVGINTTNPQATFQVVGVPNDSTKKDGIIAPRITANQLQLKTYGPEQIGALIYVTETLTSAPNLSDQTKNITVRINLHQHRISLMFCSKFMNPRLPV